jgi:hypothetical protein
MSFALSSGSFPLSLLQIVEVSIPANSGICPNFFAIWGMVTTFPFRAASNKTVFPAAMTSAFFDWGDLGLPRGRFLDCAVLVC